MVFDRRQLSEDGQLTECPSSVVGILPVRIVRPTHRSAQRGGQAGCWTESAGREAGDGSSTQFDVHQEQQMFCWNYGHDPRQYGLYFGFVERGWWWPS